MVAEALEGGILRYSRRQELLRQAARLGIGRFEANLIIAMVQHRWEEPSPPGEKPRKGVGAAVAAVALVQLLIALAAWWLVG